MQLPCLSTGGRNTVAPACLPVCVRATAGYGTGGFDACRAFPSPREYVFIHTLIPGLPASSSLILAALLLPVDVVSDGRINPLANSIRSFVGTAGLDWIGLDQGCTDTGAPIMVPVGQETLGRIMNVIGEPVDERGPINSAAKVNPEKRIDSFIDLVVTRWLHQQGRKERSNSKDDKKERPSSHNMVPYIHIHDPVSCDS